MSNPTHHDADIILKLYDLRREDVMRHARDYYFSQFNPRTVDDVRDILFNPARSQESAYFRQVTSYWDMASAMVNHGTINLELFIECNGEYVAIFAKLADLLPQLREQVMGPNYLKNLEKLVHHTPEWETRIARMKEYFKGLAQARQAGQQ